LWTNNRINLYKLKTFVYIPEEKRTKLDSKTKKCIMVGYNINCYRLWSENENKTIVSRDVILMNINFQNKY